MHVASRSGELGNSRLESWRRRPGKRIARYEDGRGCPASGGCWQSVLMLYHLLYPLHTSHSALNVIRYITFRSLIAALTSLVLSFLLAPRLIRRLTKHQIGQTIRPDGPQAHLSKAGTPTMGGTVILFSLV